MASRSPEQQALIDTARARYNVALDRLQASVSQMELADALVGISEALTELLRAVKCALRTPADPD